MDHSVFEHAVKVQLKSSMELLRGNKYDREFVKCAFLCVYYLDCAVLYTLVHANKNNLSGKNTTLLKVSVMAKCQFRWSFCFHKQ